MLEEKRKLTLSINASLIESAKQYAETHNTSVSGLVSRFFYMLSRDEAMTTDTPVLDRLTGIVPELGEVEDYYAYLTAKYDGGNRADIG